MIDPTQVQIRKWVKALRSGKYEQGACVLESPDNKFCCLGVACKINGLPTKVLRAENGVLALHTAGLPDEILSAPKWLQGMNKHFQIKTTHSLAELNDTGAIEAITIRRITDRLNFDEIADLLEAVYIYKVLE